MSRCVGGPCALGCSSSQERGAKEPESFRQGTVAIPPRFRFRETTWREMSRRQMAGASQLQLQPRGRRLPLDLEACRIACRCSDPSTHGLIGTWWNVVYALHHTSIPKYHLVPQETTGPVGNISLTKRVYVYTPQLAVGNQQLAAVSKRVTRVVPDISRLDQKQYPLVPLARDAKANNLAIRRSTAEGCRLYCR